MKSVLKYYAKLDALLDAQIFFTALELDIFTVLDNGKTAEEAAAALRFNAGKYGSLKFGDVHSLKGIVRCTCRSRFDNRCRKPLLQYR